MSAQILWISEERLVRADLLASISVLGHGVEWRGSVAEASTYLETAEPDLVFVETSLHGDWRGLCQGLASARPEVSVILIADRPEFSELLWGLRAAAFDYLVDPIAVEDVTAVIARGRHRRALRGEIGRLRRVLAESREFEELLGVSQPMQRLYAMVDRAAETTASVLITGESGTGKEVVARVLHRRSPRKDGPFVAVNCSALPEGLLESELFGHVKGAFTDAKVARSGLFVKANGGTLLLDEIGELPMTLQPKLLRALQERRVRPVGGDVEVPFDVRVIASTNRNLEAMVADREFREDLYYRINVIHVEVPPLRERAADVLLLAEYYTQHFATHLDKPIMAVSQAAAEKLLAYDWPGNVRELQNCIERAVALSCHEEVQVEDLPVKVQRYRRSHVLVVSADPSELVPMHEVERRYVLRVLDAVRGNKREAARILGFDRKTLYRKLDRYGVRAERVAASRPAGAGLSEPLDDSGDIDARGARHS